MKLYRDHFFELKKGKKDASGPLSLEASSFFELSLECDSYKELLRHFFAQALFCTFGKLGKLCFFWCYCDPRYVTFKLTLEGFKIIKASFWIRKKLLCTSFESDFQRSSYVTTCHKARFACVCAACRWSPAHQGSCIGPMDQSFTPWTRPGRPPWAAFAE